MSIKAFTRPFTQQEQINQEAIDAATKVLKSGRLHRYNTIENELSEAALLEEEYAASVSYTHLTLPTILRV